MDNTRQINKIINAVCEEYDITRETLLSGNRVAKVVEARGMAMLLMRELLNMTLKEIGEAMGRTIGTVWETIAKVQYCVKRNDRRMKELYMSLYNELRHKKRYE